MCPSVSAVTANSLVPLIVSAPGVTDHPGRGVHRDGRRSAGFLAFYGCVPSKTLIEPARRGLSFVAAAQRVRDVAAQIAATGNAEVLRGEGVDVLLERARFTGHGRVEVDGRLLTARRFVVATGAGPLVPPIPASTGCHTLTNETIFDLPTLPISLAVLGGETIGCKLARRSVASAAGSR